KGPITRVIGNKFYCARGAGWNVHGHLGPARFLRQFTAICADNPKPMTMKMDRMTVHAQVSETDTNTLIQFRNERISPRPNAAVKRKEIEIGHDVRIWR